MATRTCGWACSYLRYNVHLRSEWCEQYLGAKISAKAMKALEAMDAPEHIDELDRLGRLAGERLVKPGHFTEDFDMH